MSVDDNVIKYKIEFPDPQIQQTCPVLNSSMPMIYAFNYEELSLRTVNLNGVNSFYRDRRQNDGCFCSR